MDNQAHFYAEVGRRIRARRDHRRLTQDSLAARVGLTRTSITNIEKGRQKLLLHTLVDLAKHLHVAPQELLPEPGMHQIEVLLKGRSKKEREFVSSVISSVDTDRRA